jgi:hypothetical protein
MAAEDHVSSEPDLAEMFARFQERYKKKSLYAAANDGVDRFAAFKENILKARALNKAQGKNCSDLFEGDDCVFGITPFSDMPRAEFNSRMTGYNPGNKTHNPKVLKVLAPEKYASGFDQSQFDWRSQGKVSPIKDQNPCSVCWAFSATGTIESAFAIATGGSPPILSPEQIVDCDGSGCGGGASSLSQGFDYVQQTGGLSSESNYPTTCCDEGSGQTGACTWNKQATVQITGSSSGPQDEDSLAAALVSQGPFTIGVSASGWQQYTGGIATMGCDQNLDHAVAIVGYDKTGPTPYWIVRNQWGTQWGDQGYMYLAMGQNAACMVTTAPVIAQVAAAPSSFVV